MSEQPLSFEKSFERLEQILDLMNQGKTSLEDSLKLFEEAECLIRNCNDKLISSEQKIEALIKQRGTLSLDENGSPFREPFSKSPDPTK
jgi:exodeoxyribonuclease VII small subunit